ncbi:uncharacterized protein LODBEIA_P50660 [Lodderomyces beijingensis]|uniref:Zn(2)-C6 fungal-type domain-containing protein n=1 Tax=Lodderomyces beijingensis TaxID=1775926 RepID=A0ABP0ZRT8_9ASCO
MSSNKITRVRTGCWTCKKRHRKCDESKPVCKNCSSTNRHCEGYDIRVSFDIFQHDRQAGVKKPKSKALRHRDKINDEHTASRHDSLPREHLSASSNDDEGIEQEHQDEQEQEHEHERSSVEPVTSSTNLNYFSSDLFEDLQTLLSSAFNEKPKPDNLEPGARSLTPPSIDQLNFDSEIINFIDKSKIFDESHKELLNSPENQHEGDTPIAAPDANSLFAMSHQEENMMLKHFFKKLLPLLDGHPKSPWPDLALKYCDFDIARSCFISLACVHMYESRAGGNEYYQKGLAHINNTMDHLIRYIRENANKVNGQNADRSTLSKEKDTSKKHISYFVILVLMNVHILFAVVEKGKSSMARDFFKVFAGICKDEEFFNDILSQNSKQKSLLIVLSWYDTVSAIVSPDCRLPYCMPSWYGTVRDEISSSKMMGCPGEIFMAMSEVCTLRHKKFHGILTTEDKSRAYQNIKYKLMSYRDYVPTYDEEASEDYMNRMKCALCWSIAVWITLIRVCEPVEAQAITSKLLAEFIDIYGQMDSKSAILTQMVWPMYAIGCECKTEFERSHMLIFIDALYENTKMGTIHSLREVVLKVWETNSSQEEYLLEWLSKGVDYLPL